jgi:hypothetical protein
MKYWKWFDAFGVNSYLFEWNQVKLLKMAMLKDKIKVDMLTPSLDEELKAMAFRFKEIQLKRFKLRFHLILS